VITTSEDFTLAAENLRGFKAQEKELVTKERGLLDPINLAHKGIKDLFKPPLVFLKKAEVKIKESMVVYDRKVETARKLEEKRLQDIAEKEEKRLLKLTEKKIERAEASGKTERVEELKEEIETAPQAIAPTLAVKAPAASGISYKTTWSGEVTDKMALIKAVAAGKAPETLLDVNTKTLNQMARSMKEFLRYPGVKAVSKKDIAARC
jgi:hypothetical protein